MFSLEPLTLYEEKELLIRLNKQLELNNKLPSDLYRLRRKLCLR